MKKPGLSTFLYGGIAVCVTVMLILFSGTLTSDDKKLQTAPVSDSLFVPESVVKLTEENQSLRDMLNESKIDLELSAQQLKAVNEKLTAYEKLSEAAYYISQNDKEKANEILSGFDISSIDENARIFYEMISKEIK